MPTNFAPAGRAGAAVVERQAQLLSDNDLFRQLFDAVSDIVVVLNPQRQIIFCNRHLLDLLGAKDRRELYGLRPGEALQCVRACQVESGCGTTEFCSKCGAVNAILTSLGGTPDVRECRLLRKHGEAMEFLVRATPLELDGELCTIVAFSDVSHEKRRRALERIFFHDLMNTAVAVRMLSQVLARADAQQAPQLASDIALGMEQLVEVVAGQRDLMSAECHELSVRPLDLRADDLLADLLDTHGYLKAIRGCEVAVDPRTQDVAFRSDVTILSRVLVNMLKNAVEASRPSDTVTVGCGPCEGGVKFWVHNAGFIPPDVQLQIFHRSFTTKGSGRGLGTYSMKLLAERYLRGDVGFVTSPTQGTTFTLRLPLSIS